MTCYTQGTSIISVLANWVTVIGGLVAIGFAIWQFRLYGQLSANAAAIRSKQHEIDDIPANMAGRTQQSLVTQKQLDKLIAAEQKPLLHQIELLREDRQFIKDKLLFAHK